MKQITKAKIMQRIKHPKNWADKLISLKLYAYQDVSEPFTIISDAAGGLKVHDNKYWNKQYVFAGDGIEVLLIHKPEDGKPFGSGRIGKIYPVRAETFMRHVFRMVEKLTIDEIKSIIGE